jgi:hypothetical protein
MKKTVLLALFVACAPPLAAQPIAYEAREGSVVAAADTLRPAANATEALELRVEQLEAQLEALEAEQQQMAAGADERIDFSGQLFTRYGVNTTGTAAEQNFNSFALDRLYLTAKARVSETVSFRGTTDIVTTAPEAKLGYTAIVKYAYFDWKMRPWLTLRAGMMQTGWPNYVTKTWGYRAVSKVLIHEQGFLSTADLGAGLTAKLPNGFGEAAIGLHNGSGFKRAEADRFKDLSARLVLTPFARSAGWAAGFEVGGHTYQGTHSDGSDRVRYGGLLAYKSAGFRLGLNVETRSDGGVRGTGASAFGALGLGEVAGLGRFELLGLVEGYDPDTAASEDRELRGIVGLAYQPNADLTFALNYQQTRTQAPVFERYDSTATDADAGVFLHVTLNY